MRPSQLRNDIFNRWVRQQREQTFAKWYEMPEDPGAILTLAEAEKWRTYLTTQLSAHIERLYTEPLPEDETRYLNDYCNQELLKIRRWELRIIELGGIDYSKVGVSAPNGDILNTNLHQYQYFGRARQLPGVKELLEHEKQKKQEDILSKRPKKEDLMAKVDADYYGLGNDDELCEAERQFEASLETQEEKNTQNE